MTAPDIGLEWLARMRNILNHQPIDQPPPEPEKYSYWDRDHWTDTEPEPPTAGPVEEEPLW